MKNKNLTTILGIATAAIIAGNASAYAGVKEDVKAIDNYVRKNPTMAGERSVNGMPAGKIYLYQKGDFEIECTDKGIVIRKYSNEINKLDNLSVIDFESDGSLDAYVKSPAGTKKEWHKMAEMDACSEPSKVELELQADPFFQKKLPQKTIYRFDTKNKTAKVYENGEITKLDKKFYDGLQNTYKNFIQKVKEIIFGGK